MIGRLISFVIALAVAGAPVTLEVCAIACAAPAHQQTVHAGHDHAADGPSCHHDAARAHLAPRPHACDHGGDLPTAPSVAAVRDAHDAIDFSVILPAGASAAFATAIELSRRPASFRQSDCFGVHPAIPLRI
jgi:hypothetical protein